MRKIVFLIVILLVLSTLPLRLERAEAASRTLRIPQDYPTIQAAINASYSGDTITVAAGTYNESPTIQYSNKSNILLVGESSSNTVVNGNITLYMVNGVSIRNFDVKGKLSYRPYCNGPCYVSNNIVRKGIDFGPSSSSINNNIVYGNITLTNNGYHAHAKNDTVNNNILYGGGVIILTNPTEEGRHNTIKDNTFTNAPVGFFERDDPYASLYGLNTIADNHFVDCGIGVEFSGVLWGMGGPPWFSTEGSSVVSGNTFEHCGYGIVLDKVYNISIFQNYFLSNTVQAWTNESSPNSWDNSYPSGGNYWSDYSGRDFYHGPNQNLAGCDGMGDTPYVINVNNTDRYPLMSFSDEFSSTLVNERWTWTNQPQNWQAPSGWLLISPILGTNFWSGVDTGQFLYQWMSGNYMVETKVSASLSTNYQQAGLMIRQDANNWVKTCFEYSDGLTVKTVVNKNNVANVGQVTPVPTGTTVVWLRLVRNVDSYTAYYSFDGSMWTQQYSWSQPLQGTLMVGLSVTDGDSGVAFQPSFECFRYSNLASSSYSIQGGGSTFPCSILSNSQVSSPTFDQASKQIGFSVTGDEGTAGVCNVTFPTQLLGGSYTVLMDGSPHPATVTSNATYSSIFFTYTHSTHQFEIMGTTVVPEFPTIVSITMVMTVLTLVLFLTKRRLASLDPQSSWLLDLWSSTRANH